MYTLCDIIDIIFAFINEYSVYIPGAPMSSTFEGQSPKTMPFPTKTRVIWVPGFISVFLGVFFNKAICIQHVPCFCVDEHIWVVAVSFFFGIFNTNFGEDEPIWTSIFFKGVGSTTN